MAHEREVKTLLELPEVEQIWRMNAKTVFNIHKILVMNIKKHSS